MLKAIKNSSKSGLIRIFFLFILIYFVFLFFIYFAWGLVDVSLGVFDEHGIY